MDRAGSRLLRVELLEDDGDDDVAPAPEWRPLAGRLPRRARAAVAALVAVGVAGWTLAGRLEDRALDERLARVEGLSVSLREPLTPAWRAPGAQVLGAVGDAVLVQGADREEVHAVSVADGTVRYTRAGLCELVAGHERADGPWGDVRVRRAEDGDVLLCVGVADTPVDGDRSVRTATARVHEPATGALLRSIDLGPGATFSAVGTDVVSIGVGADGHVTAGRWSLLTGDPVWSYRSPSRVPRDDTWGSSMDDAFVRLEIGGWGLTLDTATGQRVGRARWTAVRGQDASWGPAPLPDGGTATIRLAPGGTRTTVLGADGSERFTVPGFLLAPVVDDGTAPGTLLVVRVDTARALRRLVALDARTGAARWETAARPGQVALVQGSVVVRHPAGLTALSASDGTVRWSAHAGDPGRTGWGMATDGRRVLTLDPVDGAPGLTARDLATGAPAWSAPAPVDDASLGLLPDGTVLAVGSGEVVAMRPRGHHAPGRQSETGAPVRAES